MARSKGAGDGGFRLAKDKSGSLNTVARHAARHEKITCPRPASRTAPVKSGFYETVTEVNNNLHFSFLGRAFVLLFGCDACCSPPCFYSHFI